GGCRAVKPLRGESRDVSAVPVKPVCILSLLSHTGLRAQSAPGFPCALFKKEGQRDANNPGENLPRECTHIPSRALTVCSNSENLPAPVGPDFQDALPRNRIDGPLTRKSIAPGSGTSIASGQYACEGKNS